MPSIASLRPGLEPLPGYRLSQPLGAGGFGEVWSATSPHGTLVALKFLPCHSGSSAAREIRSLQAIRQLEHPNVIRMEHVWCYQGCIVVAMEIADGSLMDLLESYQSNIGTPVAPEHACLLFYEIADALDFLNSRSHWIAAGTWHHVLASFADPALGASGMALDSLPPEHPLPAALRTRFAANPRLLGLATVYAEAFLRAAGKERWNFARRRSFGDT